MNNPYQERMETMSNQVNPYSRQETTYNSSSNNNDNDNSNNNNNNNTITFGSLSLDEPNSLVISHKLSSLTISKDPFDNHSSQQLSCNSSFTPTPSIDAMNIPRPTAIELAPSAEPLSYLQLENKHSSPTASSSNTLSTSSLSSSHYLTHPKSFSRQFPNFSKSIPHTSLPRHIDITPPPPPSPTLPPTSLMNLPNELFIQIYLYLTSSPSSLFNLAMTSHRCAMTALPILYSRPPLQCISQVDQWINTITTRQGYFNYANWVRRINFGLEGLKSSITDAECTAVGWCPKLEKISLSGCTFVTDEGVKKIAEGCLNLVGVDLSDNTLITNASLRHLSNSLGSRLITLNLSGCRQIKDDGIKEIAESCTYLRRLRLAFCEHITDDGIMYLGLYCHSMTELDLSWCVNVKGPGIDMILHGCRDLRELGLGYSGIQDLTIFDKDEKLSVAMEYLTLKQNQDLKNSSNSNSNSNFNSNASSNFNFTSNSLVTEESTSVLSSQQLKNYSLPERYLQISIASSLRVLNLTGLVSLTDSLFISLLNSTLRLRNLVVSRCTSITDACTPAIANIGKGLHYLHLGHCGHITDEGIMIITTGCPRLRYLDLANCSNITDRSVSFIVAKCTKLRRLGLVKCFRVTDKGVVMLSRLGGTLERVHLSYVTLRSITSLKTFLNSARFVTHLTLTGCFAVVERMDVMSLSRSAPDGFSEGQRRVFCVFAGNGVDRVRQLLNTNGIPSHHHYNSENSLLPLHSTSSSSATTITTTTSIAALPDLTVGSVDSSLSDNISSLSLPSRTAISQHGDNNSNNITNNNNDNTSLSTPLIVPWGSHLPITGNTFHAPHHSNPRISSMSSSSSFSHPSNMILPSHDFQANDTPSSSTMNRTNSNNLTSTPGLTLSRSLHASQSQSSSRDDRIILEVFGHRYLNHPRMIFDPLDLDVDVEIESPLQSYGDAYDT